MPSLQASSSSTPARCWHSHGSSRRAILAPPVCANNRRVDVAAIAIDTLGASTDSQLDSPGARLGGFEQQAAADDAASAAAPRRAAGTRPQLRRRHSSDPKPAQVADKALEALASQYLGPRSQVWHAGMQKQATPSRSEQDENDQASKVVSLAQQGKFQEACDMLRTLVESRGSDLYRVHHKSFMRSAQRHKSATWAYAFLKLLPRRKMRNLAPSFNMALMVCAASSDLKTAQSILKLADDSGIKADTMLFTTYIKVCKSVADVERAIATYIDMKRRGLTIDTHVIGALIATFSEAMATTSPDAASQGRKQKFVLMERALGIVKEAQESGLKLSSEVWNSLMVCAGRCGQLKRALELLDAMHLQGLRTDAYTYGALMEGCIEAQRPELALRLFEQARHEGHTNTVELYTLATSACCSPQHVDWQHAVQLYNLMQRAGVAPDSTYYSALITVAGLSGHLDYAFELLADMAAEGVKPDSSVCSAFITACIRQEQGPVARRVYDLCASRGVFPGVSQYNRLMDWYAGERRFGDVVFLLTDMTQRAKLAPNLNTYRILINACQRADQAALAFEVFAVMKANRVQVLQERFAYSMYYSLIKACLNMQRHILAQHNPHPAPWASAARKWALPEVRLAEAKQVLVALGTSLQARGSSSLLMQDPPDAGTWAQYALSCYRDMLARGWRPNHSILDKLLACLRLPGSMALQHAVMSGITNANGTSSTNGTAASAQAAAEASMAAAEGEGLEGLSAPANQQLLQAFKYQVAFERRALNLVEDAITRGLLPAFNVDTACTLDLTAMPPNLAEVYVLAVMASLERRAARARMTAGAEGGAAGDGQLFFHRITLLVPPFNPQQVLWPSYVPKLSGRQDGSAHAAATSQAAASASAAADGGPAGHTQHQDSTQALHSQQQPHDISPQQPQQQPQQSGGPSMLDTAAARRQLQQQAMLGTPGLYTPSMYDGSESDEGDADDAQASSSSAQGSLSLLQHDDDGEGLLEQVLAGGNNGSSTSAPVGATTTGLAVAATLRRLKFFARMQPSQGVIMLETSEIANWVRAKRTFEMRLSGMLSVAGAPQGAAALAQRFSQAADQPQQAAGATAYQPPTSPYQPPNQAAAQPQLGSHGEPQPQQRLEPAPGHRGVGVPAGGVGGPKGGPNPGLRGGHMVPGLNGPGGVHNPAEQQRMIRLGLTPTGAGRVGPPSGLGPAPIDMTPMQQRGPAQAGSSTTTAPPAGSSQPDASSSAASS